MSGRILIVDTVPTHRIVLKVKLLAAHYQVEAASSLEEASVWLTQMRPDLLIVDIGRETEAALAFCAELRRSTVFGATPILATGVDDRPDSRLAALAHGVDDLIDRPYHDGLITARIRSLLRASDVAAELKLREDTHRALGFSETQATFARSPRVTVIAADLPQARRLALTLEAQGLATHATDPDGLFAEQDVTAPADLFLIDGSWAAGRAQSVRLMRLISELRSRRDSRLAAQLVLAPAGAPEIAAAALDIGANEAMSASASIEEILKRTERLLDRKLAQDRLRKTVSVGLEAAITDPLTGLFNRRYALPHLRLLQSETGARGTAVCVMLLDIDHFKKINDAYGHRIGDDVLIEVGRRLRDNLRSVDLVARFGGEEFLVALPDMSAEQALGAAERLRRAIAAPPCAHPETGSPVYVTVSVGVCLATADDDPQDAIDRADIALYDAKSGGRNMVTIHRCAA